MPSTERIRTLIEKEFSEHIRSSKVPLMLCLMGCAWTVNFVIVGRALSRVGQPQLLLFLIDSLFSHNALFMSLILLFVLSSQLFQKEKQARTLETLLTTAVTPVEVWLAKSLFASAVGIIFAVAVCFLVCVALSLDLGLLVHPSGRALVFLFCIIPPLVGSIVALLALAHLLSWNPIVCNIAVMLVGMSYFAGSVARPREFALSWHMVWMYALGTIGLLIVARIMARYATRERMSCT